MANRAVDCIDQPEQNTALAAMVGAQDINPRSQSPHCKRTLSMRTQFLFLALLLVGPTLIIAAAVGWQLMKSEKQRFEQGAIQNTRNAVTAIDRDLHGLTVALQTLATTPTIIDENLAAFHAQASSTAQLEQATIVLRDFNGRQLANTDLPWGTPLPDQIPLATVDREALANGRPAVSEQTLETGNKRPSVAVVVPVKHDDRVAFLLSASVPVSRFRKVLQDEASGDWATTIVDERGVVIAQSGNPDSLRQSGLPEALLPMDVRHSGILAGRDAQGRQITAAFERTRPGWLVISSAASHAWRDRLNGALLALGSGALLITVLSFGAALWLGDRITRAMRQLQHSAAALERGEVVQPLLSTANRELDDVGTVLADASQSHLRRTAALKRSELRFRAVQDASIDGFMVFKSMRDPAGAIVDFIWVYANEAAARIVGRSAKDFIGARLLELMPGNRDEGLFDAYVRVVETGEPWIGELDYRRDGAEIYVRIVAAKADDGFAVTFADLSETRRAQMRLQESESRLARALKAGQLGVHEYDVASGAIVWDEKIRNLWGIGPDEPVNYETFIAGVHPDDVLRVQSAVDLALDPNGSGHFTSEYRVVNRKDQQIRWVVAEGTVAFKDGKAFRLIGTVRDVSQRKRSEEQRTLLINELNHRVKNTLATVYSLSRQSFRGAGKDMAPMIQSFQSRLLALSGVHDILTRQSWHHAYLHEIVESTIAPHIGDDKKRLQATGPDVRLLPARGLSIAMAMHELATNAVKYGALSNDSGRVKIQWSVLEESLRLTWQEIDGPVVIPPKREGFGTRLLKRGLAAELDGEVTMTFAPAGFECSIIMPLPPSQKVAAAHNSAFQEFSNGGLHEQSS